MKTFRLRILAVSMLVTVPSFLGAQDNASEEAVKKDRKRIQGTWRVVSLEINGNKAGDNDAKKITVVNQTDGTWTIRVDGNQVNKGTSEINPTKKPRTIDFSVTEGQGAGKRYVGVYELGEKTRKLCFVEAGRDRPADFSAPAGSERILVTFERLE
jgi:uncharacterized protein (TIGR03067 family)